MTYNLDANNSIYAKQTDKFVNYNWYKNLKYMFSYKTSKQAHSIVMV